MNNSDKTSESALQPTGSLAWVAARVQDGEPAANICEALTQNLDRKVTEIAERSIPAEIGAHVQIVAVGGYGRREIYPHGDADLVLVYRGDDDAAASAEEDPSVRLDRAIPGAAEAIRTFVADCRDSGLRIAARVRSVDEQGAQVAADATVAAASIEARHLLGPPILPDPARFSLDALLAGFDGGGPGFATLVRLGLQKRHEEFGRSAFMLEPQLKAGRGGLRDGHAVRWAQVALFVTTDLQTLVDREIVAQTDVREFTEAYAFISRVRLALHTLGRWKNDRLAFERQASVARLMGFGHGDETQSVAAFMKEFYRRADRLANQAERWLQQWTLPMIGPGRLVEPGVHVWESSLGLPPDQPATVATATRLLRTASAMGLPLTPYTRSALQALGESLGPRACTERESVDLLREAILITASESYALRALLDLGIFAKLVPEWSHIVGHTSHDVYHVYTTDRHLFESFRTLLAVEASEAETPPFVREAYELLMSRAPHHHGSLRLATLLHDVGKGLDADHSVVGCGMTREVALRLDLGDDQARFARWLVLEHLTMAKVSQRRDVRDPTEVERFCRVVEDPVHLAALTVLTYADMSSVAPGFTSSWKLDLLETLYRNALEHLTGSTAPPVPLSERQVIRAAMARGDLDDARLSKLESELAPEHWTSLDDDEVAAAVRVAGRIWDGGSRCAVELDTGAQNGRARLTICAPDRSGLLADLTAALACEQINILRARVFTTRSGLALDHFDLDWLDPGRRPWRDSRRGRVMRTVELALAQDEATLERIYARVTESRLSPPHRPPVPTEIVTMPDPDDEHLWIIEVKTRDRVGLIADITDTLSKLELDIERSIIMAEGDRAIDTFYVRVNPASSLTVDELAARVAERLALES